MQAAMVAAMPSSMPRARSISLPLSAVRPPLPRFTPGALTVAHHVPEKATNAAQYVLEAINEPPGRHLTMAQEKLESMLPGCSRVLLTHSATGALEMAALLCNVGPGDEVIVPSFTFVTSALAFVLRGATPVFVDVGFDFNVTAELIAAALTPATKAVVVVQYAGNCCDMDPIMALCRPRGVMVVEDAAQGVGARYKGRPAGTLGDLGVLSFHYSKNVQCGEGGALVVNRPELLQRAEIIWEKGTDRYQFLRGEVDKYTWRDLGSSFIMSGITAAALLAQLEVTARVTERRRALWQLYHDRLMPLAAVAGGLLELPAVDAAAGSRHNAHTFGVVLATTDVALRLSKTLKEKYKVAAFGHYTPLHSSPHGQRVGRVSGVSGDGGDGSNGGRLPNTEARWDRLLRLPLHTQLTEMEVCYVCWALHQELAEAL